jgi:hypothetical protein
VTVNMRPGHYGTKTSPPLRGFANCPRKRHLAAAARAHAAAGRDLRLLVGEGAGIRRFRIDDLPRPALHRRDGRARGRIAAQLAHLGGIVHEIAGLGREAGIGGLFPSSPCG